MQKETNGFCARKQNSSFKWFLHNTVEWNSLPSKTMTSSLQYSILHTRVTAYLTHLQISSWNSKRPFWPHRKWHIKLYIHDIYSLREFQSSIWALTTTTTTTTEIAPFCTRKWCMWIWVTPLWIHYKHPVHSFLCNIIRPIASSRGSFPSHTLLANSSHGSTVLKTSLDCSICATKWHLSEPT